MIKSSHLRVYLPEDTRAVRGLDQVERAEVAAFQADLGLMVEPMQDTGLRTEWSGRKYVCPRTPRLRMLEGVLAVRRAYGQLGRASVIPEDVARSAARELEALKEEDPSLRAHILTSAWHVPLRWFALFSDDRREVVERPGYQTIRYRTDYREAMDRLHRCLTILRRSEIPESIVAEVAELGEWMNDFPADAMVELDYGTVGGDFSTSDLTFDRSAEDLWDSLEALEDGDWQTAGQAYAALVTRWAPAMAVSYSN
jgi:hypothetical protein